jgi:hypothetical protein
MCCYWFNMSRLRFVKVDMDVRYAVVLVPMQMEIPPSA